MYFNASMIGGKHFHFGGPTASLKHWHKTRRCMSMLPWLGAFVNTSIWGALQQAWNIDIWRSRCRTRRCISTLPWLGALVNSFCLWRYSKPEVLTYDVLDVRKDDAFQRWLGAFVDARNIVWRCKGQTRRCISRLPFWGRHTKPEILTYDVLYVRQDDAFQNFHFWGHLSTLPFWECYSKLKRRTITF